MLFDRVREKQNAWIVAAVVTVAALGCLISTIGVASVQRTQEARVLEAAREMVGGGFPAWMIPHANGIVRLQKPPLAYWLSAGAFELFGVHDFAGRLPLALCGWLLVVLIFEIARRELNLRAAVFAASLLVGSFLFYRYARVAETDTLMTLALTVAVYAIWRGVPVDSKSLGWFALSGAGIGVAGLAKGLPALFAILFLLLLALLKRNARPILRWLISGAPLIAAAIALPWWIYIKLLPQGGVVNRELDVLLEGRDHPGWFFLYVPILLIALLPWTPIALLAIFKSLTRVRREPAVQFIWLWMISIAVPLCFIGNKQDHYIVPLVPPLALLGGWWLDRALGEREPLTRAIIRLTMIAILVGAFALPYIARHQRGGSLAVDRYTMSAVALLAAAALLLEFRGGDEAGSIAFTVLCALFLTIVVGVWAPTLDAVSPRQIATHLRLSGDSFCFFGDNFSLPLIFELREIVPQAKTVDELRALLRDRPGMIVIAQTKADVAPPPLPTVAGNPALVQIDTIFTKDQKLEIYRAIE